MGVGGHGKEVEERKRGNGEMWEYREVEVVDVDI